MVRTNYVQRWKWDESTKSEVLVRLPASCYRSADGLGRWAEVQRPTAYDGRLRLIACERPFGLVGPTKDLLPTPRPRVRRPKSEVRRSDGIASVSPRTDASLVGRNAYALRAELGDRAYAFWTGRRVRRTDGLGRTRQSAVRPSVKDLPHLTSGLIRVDSALAQELGIMPIRMGEMD